MTRGKTSVLDDPPFSVWMDGRLLVVGYNSAWNDGPDVPEHPGEVEPSHLESLGEHMDTLSHTEHCVRAFLVHHHPVQYRNPIARDPDFSIMLNAESLMQFLYRYRFDLLIHSHKHSPRFHSHAADGEHPLAVLCLGSFSSLLDTRWSGCVNNQFHLLHVAGRDPSTECVYGNVSSWAYTCGHGWRPSNPHNGIDHREPFGYYALPPLLRHRIRAILSSEIDAESGYVLWSSVLGRHSELSYAPRNAVMRVLAELGKELDFLVHGDIPENVVLLKNKEHHE